MAPYDNGYGQLSQQLTAEQLEEQNTANRAAQFLDKSNSMGHMPYANQLAEKPRETMLHTELLDVQLREMRRAREPKPEAQHFDTEAHRAFMRGLG